MASALPHTVFVVVSHVEIVLHRSLEQGVVASRHNVGLPDFPHAGVHRYLEVNHDMVHDLRESRNVDAVAAKRCEV